jgi:restriction system protein
MCVPPTSSTRIFFPSVEVTTTIGSVCIRLRSPTLNQQKAARVHSSLKLRPGLNQLSILQNIPPDGFQRLVHRILRESGFVKVEVKGRSGDGGIDGVGVLRLNLLSFQVFFQCKRYKDTVGAEAIRNFRGAMIGRTDKGLFITTGRFTPDAKREATRDGAPPIDLIDGEQLCEILKTLKLGVKTELVEQVTIDPDTFKGI